MIRFWVAGRPATKGDHAAQVAGGRAFIRERDAGRKAQWRARAADLARDARGNLPLLDGPIRVELLVLRLRPRGHYGTGRNAAVLKPHAPALPTSAPDLDKLQRSLGDALNGVLWRDDAQITTWIVHRRWGPEEGLEVVVSEEKIGERPRADDDRQPLDERQVALPLEVAR